MIFVHWDSSSKYHRVHFVPSNALQSLSFLFSVLWPHCFFPITGHLNKSSLRDCRIYKIDTYKLNRKKRVSDRKINPNMNPVLSHLPLAGSCVRKDANRKAPHCMHFLKPLNARNFGNHTSRQWIFETVDRTTPHFSVATWKIISKSVWISIRKICIPMFIVISKKCWQNR